ncbi:MAG: pirin family protein [Nitrososphaera sp.]|uniref:pirin family protein n=1 Tax=Nitrososphaera sp. TaxID=1971748 RepID=UPI003D6E3205
MNRTVSKIVNATETMEGEGFLVHRPFPTNALNFFDPFLLLDEMGPMELAPGEAKGAPDHPHRGFETVTYLLEGSFEHKDSQGNAGRLHPGDVQWMTAGAGVVHSEMPEKEFARAGGKLHGFQLWVNLPKKDKMMPPRYQDVPASKMPSATKSGARVRVIAGESLGAKAAVDTRTPIMYLHFTLDKGASVSQPVPPGYNVFAYVVEGEGAFGGKEARRGQMVMFGTEGDAVEIKAKTALSVLLIGGVPLNEPVARYGPFVMNTREEVHQAIEDYRAGKMGSIAAST